MECVVLAEVGREDRGEEAEDSGNEGEERGEDEVEWTGGRGVVIGEWEGDLEGECR